MLEKWSVTNFKSIPKTIVITSDGTETGTLDLKPLTVLCGANSSGKSSLLQSILLIAQTMRHRDKEFPIVLNGDYTSLGTFDDVKTLGSEGEEIGICFTYKLESDSLIYKNEYPFNHIEAATGQFFDKKNHENRYCIDTVSCELLFSQPNNINRTKILPMISKTVLSIIFFQEREIEISNPYLYPFAKDMKKGAYTLKWISESENTKQHSLKEIFILPDGKMVDMFRGELPFLPAEVIHNGEFKKKLAEQFSLEKINANCVFNHFFLEALNLKINYICIGFLIYINHVLEALGYDNNIIQLNSEEISHVLKNAPRSFLLMLSRCYTLSEKIREDVEFREKIKELLQNKEIATFTIFLDSYKKLIDNWKESDSKDLSIYNEHIKPLLDGTAIVSLDISYFIRNHLSEIFDFFSKNIYYLGPLREDPRSLYPYPNNDDSFDLGRKGEHTANVLFLHGEQEDAFPLPNQKEDTVKTIDAIKQWLDYIGVADDIKTELDSGIALKIQTPESPKWSDLTNVGVGVSQVIPIVVMCLTAKKGTTLVIEQPELHLHPKMQTRLAEFFMAIADSGVQCIIETHSEHFINAMRLNIASDDLGKEKMIDKSIIYFVEKIQNSSVFREIKINDLGIIPHWPKDFFDEDITQTDKIILASSKKRTQKFPEDEEMDDE